MNERLTAWCSLCCADCIPSNYGLFSVVKDLEEMLSNLQFDEYAKLKAEKNPAFKEYPVFLSVLKEIKSLKCSGPCREGGGKPDCEVRKCAQERGYFGCWECSDLYTCTKLDPLRLIHSNLDYNLELIGKYGPKNWLSKRKAHYKWQKDQMKDKYERVP